MSGLFTSSSTFSDDAAKH